MHFLSEGTRPDNDFDPSVDNFGRPSSRRQEWKNLLLRSSLTNTNEEECTVTLSESTHTLLHTTPLNSITFVFALGVALLSLTCLTLALWYELSPQIPADVSGIVRVAQYCGERKYSLDQ